MNNFFVAIINEENRQKAEKILLLLVFFFFALYVVNAIGNVDELKGILGKRRYLNALWILLGVYLIVSKGRANWDFFWKDAKLVLPVAFVAVLLDFYHDCGFDVSYAKYALLLILVGSVVCKIKTFGLREFFIVNSLSCLAIFAVAIYQMDVLRYPIPNGDINQNIFACLVFIIGNVSLFSVLYGKFNHGDRLIYAICGILAIWVALRTTCRTAYVTETALVCMFSYLAHKRYEWSVRKSVLFIVIALVSMLLVVATSPIVTEHKFRVISLEIQDFFGLGVGETTDSSIGLRLAMWKAALFDVIPNHFWLGVGDIRLLDWPAILKNSNIDADFLKDLPHFHNEGINLFVMGGVLLFVACNWLLYKLFLRARTEPVLLCLLAGAVMWGMTEVSFRHKPFLVVFLSIWLLYECAMRNEGKDNGAQSLKSMGHEISESESAISQDSQERVLRDKGHSVN